MSSAHHKPHSPKASSKIRKLYRKILAVDKFRPSTQEQSEGSPADIADPGSGVYLRINEKYLLRFPNLLPWQPIPPLLLPEPGSTRVKNILAATLANLLPYAGDTVDWLIDVARLIFEPFGTSSLYTFTDRDMEWWMGREMDQDTWRQVQPGEQLGGTIYEFRPDNDQPLEITKLSLPHSRVVTHEPTSQSSEFRATLLRRHGYHCAISGQPDAAVGLVASHLLPKRLGAADVQSICQRFVRGAIPPQDPYDSRLGLPLYQPFDRLMNTYHLGFSRRGNNQYIFHDFSGYPTTIFGCPAGDFPLQVPLVHGRQITLLSHDPSLDLPPEGVFNWHYIQCVLTRFSTSEYRSIPNVTY